MYVTITRESVSMADDAKGLHKKKLRNIEKRSFHAVLKEIRDHYLPQGVKGGSTWIIELDARPTAIIAFPSREMVFLHPAEKYSISLGSGRQLHAKRVGTISAEEWVQRNRKE